MTRRLKNWQREVWAYEVSAASDRSGADHRAGLCIDLGEPEPIRQESRRRALSGISAQSGGLRRHPATIRNQQSRRYDAAPATGRERAVHLGAVRTGHRLTTVWATVMRAGRKECEEASGGSRGPEAGSLTAPSLGEWRGVRTAAAGLIGDAGASGYLAGMTHDQGADRSWWHKNHE